MTNNNKSARSRFLITYWINVILLVILIGLLSTNLPFGGLVMFLLTINILVIASDNGQGFLRRDRTTLQIFISVIMFFVIVGLFSMVDFAEIKADNNVFEMATDIMGIVTHAMLVTLSILYAWKFRKIAFHI
ncbi:hypothetical protein [Pediococcus argentinicus]|uniref:hypothetical protein n=1 Tax=Pediococcus argentinicus TaxID=480391 RepID=UPI000708E91F|nr:hypothetical protein [Pediococcus argentinicus]NKZ22396.1 hypothetical protein [Pediococcus argentinicus]GEP19466.1 hypothetical protein LSA03_08500 [Pediococcus argentinicus]